jgi:hypothetical protein
MWGPSLELRFWRCRVTDCSLRKNEPAPGRAFRGWFQDLQEVQVPVATENATPPPTGTHGLTGEPRVNPWPPTVKVEWFTTTDDVVWTGRDGKPRCAKHPYVCLVPITALPSLRSRSHIQDGDYVCARCMRDTMS